VTYSIVELYQRLYLATGTAVLGGGRSVDIFAGGMVRRGCLEGGRGSRIEDEAQGGGNRPTLLTGWLRWAQGRSRTP
jgi:hypothetical protein